MMRRFSIFLFFTLFILLMFSSCDAIEKMFPPNIIPPAGPPPEGIFFSLNPIEMLTMFLI